MQWRVDRAAATVTLALSGNSSLGWMGFGFAETNAGGMSGADMVTVRFLDPHSVALGPGHPGKLVVEDRYTPWSAFPSAPYGESYLWETGAVNVSTSPGLWPELDTGYCAQDWLAVSSSMTSACSVAVVARALDTGDAASDRVIVLDEPMRVLAAWGSTRGRVGYHGASRASSSIHFGKAQAEPAPGAPQGCMDDEESCNTLDLRINAYEILPQETTYVCQSFLLPDDAQHAVGIEVLPDNVAHVHHILVHSCGRDETPLSGWRDSSTPLPCGASDNTLGKKGVSPLGGTCRSLVYAWAVGGNALVLPAEAGVRLGRGALRFVTVEIHYDNPGRVVGELDSTVLRLTVTKNLRANDAGVLMIGDPSVSSEALPHGLPEVHRVGLCSGSCTQGWNSSVHVFGSFLHMHSFGKRMWINHMDENLNMLGVLDKVEHWDFNFQRLSPVSRVIKPGDSLFVHADFDTSKWPRAVRFGTGSLDEMAMSFLFYYPEQIGGLAEICGGLINSRSAAREALESVERNETRREALLDTVLGAQPELGGRLSVSLCGRGIVMDGHTEKAGSVSLSMQPLDPTYNATTGKYLSPFGILGQSCARANAPRLDLLSAGARPGPSSLLAAALLALSATSF